MASSASDRPDQAAHISGTAIIALLLGAAVLAWCIGGSMVARSLFPAMLTVTAVLLSLATPFRYVRSAVLRVTTRLTSDK
jgi:hypothetical protein